MVTTSPRRTINFTPWLHALRRGGAYGGRLSGLAKRPHGPAWCAPTPQTLCGGIVAKFWKSHTLKKKFNTISCGRALRALCRIQKRLAATSGRPRKASGPALDLPRLKTRAPTTLALKYRRENPGPCDIQDMIRVKMTLLGARQCT